MKIAKINKNDIVNGEGVCVSLWVSGCPHHCKGCHNPELWNFDYGTDTPLNLIDELQDAITKNGIQRNFSVLGGEPLCPDNLPHVSIIIHQIRMTFPTIKIFVWTGYEKEEIFNIASENPQMKVVLNDADVLIVGRFILEQRDITLPLRGSKNQQILTKNVDF